MPSVHPRLAPALGLAAACVMLTVIGAIAIDTADSPQQPTGFAGAIPLPRPSSAEATASRQLSGSDRTGVTNSIAAAPAVPTNSAPPTGSASPFAAAQPTGQTIHARQSAGTEEYAQAVFQAVNRARAAQHLAPLVWDARLQQSARTHNRAMAGSNTLSHQVGTEPALGNRESSAGVQWAYAAENIGWTTERSLAGVLDIEARMLSETAPNDAHRRNILARSAQSLGVDVYFDATHDRLWLTEDFAGG